MPFNRPTLPELRERIRADIRARLPEARPELRRSLLGVLADVESGGLHSIYGYLDYLARQVTPHSAEGAILEDWARTWTIQRQAATSAGGAVRFTGSSGTVVPQGTRLQADNDQEYTTDVAATLVAGEVNVPVTATEGGEDGNLNADSELQLVSPVVGVDATATVVDGLTGGADEESDTRLRERLLDRIRRPPHGGSRADYERWAREGHPDVTRDWVYPNETEDGTVTVRIMTDDATVDGIPTQEVVDAVSEYINGSAVRPVQVSVYVVAPAPVPLALEIRLTPDTAEARERVEQAAADYIRREGEPGGTLYREQLSGVIYVAAGESRHELISPVADVVHGTNEIPVPGVITWTV